MEARSELSHLFERNRAWADDMERSRPGFFSGLARQQLPDYMWIGCSDSRVPANQITGLEPGEVFVHRNVANVVVPTDLNALSALQYAVDVLKVRHVMVVGHYGCGGVQAALSSARIGLADQWIRHVVQVRERHADLLEKLSEERRANALVELNVVEQVMSVCKTTILSDAWAAGRILSVHGWVYGIHDGLLQDLHVTVRGEGSVASEYQRALAWIRDGRASNLM